jgi:glycosyltransferase involved in cell wall biosynthesis
LKVAKRQGTVTLLENPGSHARNWLDAGAEECRRYGLDPRTRFQAMTLPQVRRIEEEYRLCDRIIVPSEFSYRTFVEFGLAEKAIIVLPGVDTELFAPSAEAKNRDLFRACFVGRIELAKGMGYLLEAWKRLNLPNAELVLVGEVKPEMKSIFEKFGSSNIRTTGTMTVGRVAECYRNSDLFVLPSVNEGLAQVLLEAMSSGLAVVASDRSGAEDCVTDGKEGFVVPARDVERLADAILWCYQHREETRAMGRAARARIESAFTLDHYNARQMAVYRDIGLEDRDSVR